MNGSIDENTVGRVLDRFRPTAFNEFGLGNPAATYHTTRPGEGRDGDTTSRRWCL